MSLEVPVVVAKVVWLCPECGKKVTGKTDFRCFTNIATCEFCYKRVIVNINEGP